MKNICKILMVSAIALISINANAQFGIKAGYVTSTPKTTVTVGGTTVSPPNPAAFNGVKVGFDYNAPLGSSGLSLRPGLNYIYFSGRNMDDPTDNNGSNIFHFANIPIDLKYQYDFNNDFGLYAFAGPRVVVGMVALSKWEEDGYKETLNLYTGKYKWKDSDGTTGEETDKNDAMLSRVDLQIGLGLGLQFKAFSLEFGYDFGMMNMVKKNLAEVDGDKYKISRGQLGITLGYAFGK